MRRTQSTMSIVSPRRANACAAAVTWVASRSQRNWPTVISVPGGPKPKWRATYCQKCWGTKMCRRRASSERTNSSASQLSTSWASAVTATAARLKNVRGQNFEECVEEGTVIAGFSSGELNAYRYENGRQVWQDELQRTSVTTTVSSLADIDADPVIDNGQVFAVGQGGRMVALDITSGQRLWELDISGISTPWVAGDWVWVVTSDARLLCIARANGHIRWIQKLPRYVKAKSKKGELDYQGPILAGGRLIVVGSSGVVVHVDPQTGSYQSQTNVGAPVSLPPVVANSTLYIFDDRARLHA